MLRASCDSNESVAPSVKTNKLRKGWMTAMISSLGSDVLYSRMRAVDYTTNSP